MNIQERLNDLYELRQRLIEQIDEPIDMAQFTRRGLAIPPETAELILRQTKAMRELAWTEKQILALLRNPGLG